jgi:outer membrane protein TolC
MKPGVCAAWAAIGLSLAGPTAAQTTNTPFAGSVVNTAVSATPLPLALDDAVARGLRYNLGLLTAENQVASARGARVRALKDLLPRVEARAGETRETTNLAAFGFDPSLFPGLPSIVGPFSIFDARVAGSQTVFDLSAVNEVRSKKATLAAAELDVRNSRDLVTYVVTMLYFQAVAGERRIETARGQVTTAEALFALATSQRNAGVAPGIDVVRAQVQLQAQRQRLLVAENDAAKARLQLVRAIGVPTAQTIALTEQGEPMPAPATTLNEALTRAEASRADYQAARERVAAAEAALRAARTSALPSLRVNADVGAIGASAGDARRTYAMSANVRVPLFDPDRRGREAEDVAAVRQRQAELDDLAQKIEAEVRTAWLDVQSTEQQAAVAKERVALADQELRLARIRFSAGVSSNLEVIQAQTEVSVAADNAIASAYAVNVARAALKRAVGTSPAP